MAEALRLLFLAFYAIGVGTVVVRRPPAIAACNVGGVPVVVSGCP
jgi:hypothetical protein